MHLRGSAQWGTELQDRESDASSVQLLEAEHVAQAQRDLVCGA